MPMLIYIPHLDGNILVLHPRLTKYRKMGKFAQLANDTLLYPDNPYLLVDVSWIFFTEGVSRVLRTWIEGEVSVIP